MSDAAWNDWVAKARSVPIEVIADKRGLKLARVGAKERIGPCPICNGIDRFSINIPKQVFNCRQCEKGGRGAVDFVMFLDSCRFKEAAEKLAGAPPPTANGHDNSTRPTVNGEWIYRDAFEEPYLRVRRLQFPDGRKAYPQAHWADSTWQDGAPKGAKLPYRLPEMMAADKAEPVWITEGEKCAEAVAGLGLVATTASEGAGKWTADLNTWFRDRIVYILPDNDLPGARHADDVAKNLAGIAKAVCVVKLPGLALKEDVFDWITRGGTRDQLDQTAAPAAVWHPGNGADPGIDQGPDGIRQESGSASTKFKLVKLDDIKTSTTVDYAIKGLIPRKGLVIVWGPPKCGKSFKVFTWMMHVAMGRDYRGHRVHQNEVAYLALEGQEGYPRRRDAFYGHYLEPGETVPLFNFCGVSLDLINDHQQLIADIRAQAPNVGCVTIDTLNRSLNGSESSDEDMAAYLKAADAIKDEFNCVVIIIHHCGHNGERPRGHSSLIGAADMQIAIKKDDAGIVAATVELAKDMPEGVTINSRLEVVELGIDQDGDPITSCVVVELPEGLNLDPERSGAVASAVAKKAPSVTADQQRDR
jgi:hypothetical protein